MREDLKTRIYAIGEQGRVTAVIMVHDYDCPAGTSHLLEDCTCDPDIRWTVVPPDA